MLRFKSLNEWWFSGACRNYDGILLDIDGTLLSGGRRALPGALELVASLRETGFPFGILTNDGNHSREEKSSFLNAAGFQFEPEDIISCALVLKPLAAELSLQGCRVFVMGELGAPVSYAELAGMVPVYDPEQIESCRAVIVGEGHYDWCVVIEAVVNFLMRHPELPLIAPNPDTHWPNGHGGIGIGAGATSRFIAEFLADLGFRIRRMTLGKPERAIFDYALEKMFPGRIPDRRRILMVGDFLKSDIRGANRSGLTSALVLTGVTNEELLAEASGEDLPQFVFHSLAASEHESSVIPGRGTPAQTVPR